MAITITPENLKEEEDPLKTVNLPQEEDLTGTINGAIDYTKNLADANNAQSSEEQATSNTQRSITDLMNTISGKEADTQTANEESGLNAATKQLSMLNAQASSLNREAQAIPIQTQQKASQRLMTDAGAAPITAAAQRTNALKALSIAQQSDVATANWTAAKDKAKQMIDIKYAPMEARLEALQQQYTFNKDNLERIDKKQADALAASIKQQETTLDNQKEKEDSINSIALEATKNKAPASVINAISNAKTIGEALAMSSGFMSDALEEQLKLAQINKYKTDQENIEKQFEIDKYKFGEELALKNRTMALDELEAFSIGNDDNIGKTVEQDGQKYLWNTETQNYDIKVGGDGNVSEKDVETINALKEKSTLIGIIQTDPNLSNISGTGAKATLGFQYQAIKGNTQDSISRIEQIINKETLDTLINLKAKGGTLGALSEKEADMLRSAATSIGNARVKDKSGSVIGYNLSEKELRNQLQLLKNNTNRMMLNAVGTSDDNFDREFGDSSESQNLWDFNNGSSGTPTATKTLSLKSGEKGGQCGRFVNNITGLGLGDSYMSKMTKMDKTIKEPEAGMVFVMPYKDTGHTGIILSVKDGIATVKDSNWSLDEKVKVHDIPVSKMTGFKRITV